MMAQKKRLLIVVFSMMFGVAFAQWNADSTEYDSYKRFRVGGYGEMVANFKNYGTRYQNPI